MWKYKEFFAFTDLGNTPNSGELDFILAIIEKNVKSRTDRDLNGFVQKINNRFDNDKNSCIILRILCEISNYHDIPYL